MVQIVSKNIAKPTTIAIASENDLVVMKFGNVEVKLHYLDALKVSQWIRIRAKEAKRFAGDTGRHWSAAGVLTDANQTRG